MPAHAPITRHDVLAVLQEHVGRARGVTAEYLATALGIETRYLRSLITELRLEAYGVCANPRNGYFIAANSEELEEECAFLRGRAMHSLALEAQLRKSVLPDLRGQARLKT